MKQQTDLQNVREQDIATDALEGIADNTPIPEINLNPHLCDHAPELLKFAHIVKMPGYDVLVFRCKCCGKEVVDYAPSSEEYTAKEPYIQET